MSIVIVPPSAPFFNEESGAPKSASAAEFVALIENPPKRPVGAAAVGLRRKTAVPWRAGRITASVSCGPRMVIVVNAPATDERYRWNPGVCPRARKLAFD